LFFACYDFKEGFDAGFDLRRITHAIVGFDGKHRQILRFKCPVNFDGFYVLVVAVLQSVVDDAVSFELLGEVGYT